MAFAESYLIIRPENQMDSPEMPREHNWHQVTSVHHGFSARTQCWNQTVGEIEYAAFQVADL